MRDLAGDFLPDAAALIESLDEAARTADWGRFSTDLHALRSCAANVGAGAIVSRCRRPAWTGETESVAQALDLVALLKDDLVRYEAAIIDYLSRRPADGAAS